MAYSVKLEKFEGPLDLLLHLIGKAELDVYEISINDITQQYIEYLKNMQKLELNLASEFIVMATTLISIKSRKLLPKPVENLLVIDDYDDLDPREALVMRLLMYKKYKKTVEELKKNEQNCSTIYTLPCSLHQVCTFNDSELLLDMISVYDLVRAWITGTYKRYRKHDLALISKEIMTIEEKINYIKTCLSNNEVKKFSELIMNYHITEVVNTLLAVLELMKRQEIVCVQDVLFEDFIVRGVFNSE